MDDFHQRAVEWITQLTALFQGSAGKPALLYSVTTGQGEYADCVAMGLRPGAGAVAVKMTTLLDPMDAVAFSQVLFASFTWIPNHEHSSTWM